MDPPPLRYFELIRQMKNPFNYRIGLVDYARSHGLKAASRSTTEIRPALSQAAKLLWSNGQGSQTSSRRWRTVCSCAANLRAAYRGLAATRHNSGAGRFQPQGDFHRTSVFRGLQTSE